MRKHLEGRLLSTILMGIILVLPLLAGIPDVVAEEVYIICNKDVPLEKLSREDVKKIFLGLKTEWNSQLGAKFALLTDDSPIHKQFLKTYINKSVAQFTTYWKQRLFMGAGSLPRPHQSETDIIEYVANTKGAIGYASGSSNPSVKIISVQ